MSGRRCKALRKAFREKYGREVEHASWKKRPGLMAGWSVTLSEWRRLKRGMIPVAILLCLPAPSFAADVCRDATGKFTACPETVIEPDVVAAVTPEPPRIRVRAMVGGLTALATDTEAAIEPLGSLSVAAPLTTWPRGPRIEVQADLTALPGETLDLADPTTFRALEFAAGICQPLPQPLLFDVCVTGGFASRLSTTEEPVSRLPGFWAFETLFETASGDHRLKVGIGMDERLSGELAPAVTISGRAKVGERAGVSLYLVGSLIRALDWSYYGYSTPARDSLRIGIGIGGPG